MDWNLRYFDDWTVGESIETESHLMTEDRIMTFAEEFDPQPFHVDRAAAEASIYGGIIASGWHTGSVLMRLKTTLLGASSMGSPGGENFGWRAPVYPGDQLRLRSTVLEGKPSASKPDRGMVTYADELLNQDDQVVMTLNPVLMMKRRP
mgnify:CR=1 FL=1